MPYIAGVFMDSTQDVNSRPNLTEDDLEHQFGCGQGVCGWGDITL